MEGYNEAVAALFEQQGFDICRHEGDCERHDDLADVDIVAEDEEQRLLIFCLPELEAAAEVEEAADQLLAGIDLSEQDKTLFFVSPDIEDRDALEEFFATKDAAEVSFFRPSEPEDSREQPEWMPSSYEIIGNIAILNLEEERWERREEIAAEVQEQNPNVETVLAKIGQLDGEFRVGEYEKIIGGSTETTHTEHGCRYKVDPTKVYFSERLGFERQRVAEQVEAGETVQVWFAGVGPYAILFAREKQPRKVYAIEKNPEGCEYMKENVELNKVGKTVEALCGDVREIVPGLEEADRIVMPLPGSADEFLDLAFEAAKPGCTVHYYRFVEEEEQWEKPLREIHDAAERAGREVEVVEKVVCGHYAPYVDRVCIDFRIDD